MRHPFITQYNTHNRLICRKCLIVRLQCSDEKHRGGWESWKASSFSASFPPWVLCSVRAPSPPRIPFLGKLHKNLPSRTLVMECKKIITWSCTQWFSASLWFVTHICDVGGRWQFDKGLFFTNPLRDDYGYCTRPFNIRASCRFFNSASNHCMKSCFPSVTHDWW